MPLACGVGDLDLPHCSLPVRATGNPKVLLGGRPWSCVGDVNIPHLVPVGNSCVPHVAPIGVGAPTTLIGGRCGGVVGSKLISCTAVATGHPKVWVSA